MLTLKEFSRRYAETYHVTYDYANTICQTIFRTLGRVLYEDKEDVVIYGFGAFKHKKTKEKAVRHPVTGEMSKVPERDVVKFHMSEAATRNHQ